MKQTSNVESSKTKMAERKTEGKDHQPQEKRKKESILDMTKFLEKPVRVKFVGGREASGTLKGFDP